MTHCQKEVSLNDYLCASSVVAITLFDLKKRGLVQNISLCGVNGMKFPSIRSHMKQAIVDKYPKHGFDISCKTYPDDVQVDPKCYKRAIKVLPPQSVVIIFTPDDTHYEIAKEAVQSGHHVLVTKPAVKTLKDHLALSTAADKERVLVAVEVHKRWDPIYADARDRLAALGDFSFLSAYMSQPKLQLHTFAAWAGIASDISYYLNSHHIDFHEWCYAGRARPIRVTASASTGVAQKALGRAVDDTVTLLVQWEKSA
jgi:D-galacturonate reductase